MRMARVIEVAMVGRALNGLSDSDGTIPLSVEGTLVQPVATPCHSGSSNGHDSSTRHHAATHLL